MTVIYWGEGTEEYMVHFPVDISPEIVRYAKNKVFSDSRYLFVWEQSDGQKRGYCTHCQEEYPVFSLKHKSKIICPSCMSELIIQFARYGRKKLRERAYFVYYEKSLIDPQSIVARGFFAVIDYEDGFRNVVPRLSVQAYYVFTPGKPVMISLHSYYERVLENNSWKSCTFWEIGKSVRSLFPSFTNAYFGRYQNAIRTYSKASIKQAVRGTPYEYSGWKEYDYQGMERFFALFSSYPCIEYLTKLGFKGLVEAKMERRNTLNTVNWRGKTLAKVLRVPLSKAELKEIRRTVTSVDPELLKLMQLAHKEGSVMSIEDLENLSASMGRYFEPLYKVLKFTSLFKIYGYVKKQYKRQGAAKRYVSFSMVLRDWGDYLDECLQLKFDLKSEYVLFPPDLHKAHQSTTKLIRVKKNEVHDKKIVQRLQSLRKRYHYECGDYFIRPLVSAEEVIEEGQVLHHCVGNYIERYATGQLDLLVIRKRSEPDKPFYTVEISNNDLRQVRGKNNCVATPEVNEFVEGFIFERLDSKKQRVRVTA